MKDEPHHLSRFVQAQKGVYEQALSEIKRGPKRSHWMWFIFPQLDGLASSATSRMYSIKSLEEAKAYLDHADLGQRLIECADAVVRVQGRSVTEIFGSPDDLKLRSCATLFECASPTTDVFDRLLEKYYRGSRDNRTLRLLGMDSESQHAD